MDFIQQLRVFVAVADQGSFARAADVLGMGRPAVTNVLAALEASVGARLLQRTTRRSSLTGEGEQFYERASRILFDVEDARNLFGHPGQAPRGRLRIDIPAALAKPLVIPRLPEFVERYPGIEMVFGVSDHPIDLLAEGVDCVVRLGELTASSMISRVVGRLEMVTCAAPSYLDRLGVPRNLDDLSNHRAIHYFSGRDRRTIDWHFELGGEKRMVPVRSTMLVNDSEAFIDCAVHGLGIIQALAVGVDQHLRAGKLVEILPDLPSPRRMVSVVYPNRQHLAPQVRAFVDWIAEVFREPVAADGATIAKQPPNPLT